jgi:hypothetical protein
MKSNTDRNQERKSRNATRLAEDKLSTVTGGTNAPDHSEMARATITDGKATRLEDLGLYSGSDISNIYIETQSDQEKKILNKLRELTEDPHGIEKIK